MGSKIRVAFDVNCLANQRLTGVGNVALNLFLHISKNSSFEIIPYLKFSRIKKAKYVKKHLGIKPKIWFPWYQFLPPKLDLYHGPDFKIPVGGNFKKLVTIHDIVEFDGRFNSDEFLITAQKNFKEMLYKSIPDHIHTVSEFTKSRICFHFPYFCNSITTVYPGINHLNNSSSEIDNYRKLPKNYILFVGTLELRKNVLNVIESFLQFSNKSQDKNFSLVLVGRFGFGENEINKKVLTSKNVLHFADVNNHELQHIYKKASAFIFPSFYEGFGLPVLEAMLQEIPVITSNTGALSEISSDAALKVSPDSIEEISEAILKITQNHELRNELISKGKIQAQKFTWEKSAAELAQLYLKIINS